MAKIYNEVIIDMNPESSTFEKVLHEDSFEHDGEMMLLQVSLAGARRGSAKRTTARKLAKKAKKQKGKESFLGGLLALAKPVSGFISKNALKAFLNVTGGGILSPLFVGMGTTAITELADRGLRALGFGADPDEIKAESAYGYGEESAKTIREGLEQSIEERDPWSAEGFMTDIVGQYASALTPQFNPVTGKFEGGDLYSNIEKAISSKAWFKKGEEDALTLFGRGGGKIPEYKGGGMVEGEGTTTTIVDYFARQGKTLGGSNTQSVAEMLGRK